MSAKLTHGALLHARMEWTSDEEAYSNSNNKDWDDFHPTDFGREMQLNAADPCGAYSTMSTGKNAYLNSRVSRSDQ